MPDIIDQLEKRIRELIAEVEQEEAEIAESYHTLENLLMDSFRAELINKEEYLEKMNDLASRKTKWEASVEERKKRWKEEGISN